MTSNVTPGAATDRGTVLVVEDNFHSRKIILAMLEHYGFQVVEAVDGEQALQMLQAHRPHIILMDLSLPVFSGYDLVRHLKADPRYGQIPIIALTAHSMPGDEEKARAAGCDHYIAKPCDPEDVVQQVIQMLGDPPPAAA